MMVVIFASLVGLMNLYVYFAPQWSAGSAASQDHRRMSPQVLEQQQQQQQLQESPAPQRGAQEQGLNHHQHATLSAPQIMRDKSKPKNVLFIMTDDLRPSLSIYDKPVITPAMDRLAAMGVVFERAYNQVVPMNAATSHDIPLLMKLL